MNMITDGPQWFVDAINTPYRDCYAEVNGAKVHYLAWGDPNKQGIVLVHGNGAHSRWFQFVGPLLADDYHVASIDLSGMGDSDWREGGYVRETFAEDIWGVCQDAGMTRPIIAAHSFGGFVGLIAAHHHSQDMNGIIYLDYAVKPPERHEEWYEDRPPSRPTRVYETHEEIMGRFRLTPPQPVENEFLLKFIAEHSVREVEGGWTWKFDHRLYDNLRLGQDLPDMVRGMQCPQALIFGVHSVDIDPVLDPPYMQTLMGENATVVGMDAHHHLMLEKPHEMVDLIKQCAAKFLQA